MRPLRHGRDESASRDFTSDGVTWLREDKAKSGGNFKAQRELWGFVADLSIYTIHLAFCLNTLIILKSQMLRIAHVKAKTWLISKWTDLKFWLAGVACPSGTRFCDRICSGTKEALRRFYGSLAHWSRCLPSMVWNLDWWFWAVFSLAFVSCRLRSLGFKEEPATGLGALSQRPVLASAPARFSAGALPKSCGLREFPEISMSSGRKFGYTSREEAMRAAEDALLGAGAGRHPAPWPCKGLHEQCASQLPTQSFAAP